MNKGGRRKDPIWELFSEIEENGKKCAKCKSCGHVQSIKACRMRSHVKSCKSEMGEKTINVNSSSTSTSTKSIQQVPEVEGFDSQKHGPAIAENQEIEILPKKRKIQSSIDNFCCSTTENEKKKLDKLLGLFFYSCNVPFSHVENKHFKEFISVLRPGYKLPSRKSLAGHILDEVHEELQNEMKNKLKDKTTTLVVDGWSNIHNEPVIVAALHAEGKSYIVDAIHTGADHKTAEYLTDMSKEIIKHAADTYNCHVKTIVTDNTNTMIKMRQQLEKKDVALISSGCQAHYLNLLGQDITPKTIVSHVIKVQKFFRNHHSPGAWLRDYPNTVMPQLPGETRWNSQLKCLETYLTNHAAFISIVNNHTEEIDSTVADVILNFNLHKQVKDLTKQLKPICNALDRLQSDKSNLADACHEWLGLLEDVELKHHYQTIKERFNKAILPYHIFVYFMHPKYKGERLSSEQRELARKWIETKNKNLLPFMIYFENGSGPFPKTYFAVCDTLDPVVWWKGMKKIPEIPHELCDLVITLLTCPSSSAGLERIFSSFGYIHSKLRNRLLHNTAKKLLFCHTMLRMNSNNDENEEDF